MLCNKPIRSCQDGSGSIDFDEFLEICGGGDSDTDKEACRALFDAFDGNSSGTLELVEMNKTLSTNSKVRKMAAEYEGLRGLVKMARKRKKKKSSRSSKRKERGNAKGPEASEAKEDITKIEDEPGGGGLLGVLSGDTKKGPNNAAGGVKAVNTPAAPVRAFDTGPMRTVTDVSGGGERNAWMTNGPGGGGGGNSKRVKKAFGHEKKTDDQGIEIDPFDTRKRNTRTGGLSAYGKE